MYQKCTIEHFFAYYLPLCSPRKTSLNLRKGLPNSPDADIVNGYNYFNTLNYNFTVILITENYMNNDSSGHSCGSHERSAATLRQTDGTMNKPTQQNLIIILYLQNILYYQLDQIICVIGHKKSY